MIKQYLDLTATDAGAEMFRIPQERLDEMNDHLHALEVVISTNHKIYTTPGTVESPGDGLHPGKVLECILEIAKNPNEELAILFAFPEFTERVLDSISRQLFIEKVAGNHPEAKIQIIKM